MSFGLNESGEFTEKRNLKYQFTQDERISLSEELANNNQKLRQLEDEKKSITSEYGSKINITKEQINITSDKVASGYELREITCSVVYHLPEKNKKTLTRSDNGESFVERMTDYDHNIFTQYQEEHGANEANDDEPAYAGEDGYSDDDEDVFNPIGN